MEKTFSGIEQIILIVTAPTYAILILLEMALSNWHGKKIYAWRDVWTNLYITFCNMVLDALTRSFIILTMAWAFQFHIIDLSSSLKVQHAWLYWTLCIVGWEFMFYWMHRLEHTSRFFWAVHVTHHSSEHFNLSVGFRSSVFEPIYRFAFYLPLALVGFEPRDCFLVFAVTQIYGLFVHTQYIGRIPVWEWLFVTPAHHRVHHACNVRYLDRNMGMFLIIWDRLFGTYADEVPNEKIEYGLVKKNVDLSVPFNVIIHEWKAIFEDIKRRDIPLSCKLKYVFKAPGWSHDGSRKTSEQMREDIEAK
jgi:sterol desaturase/sphingolipid hydroxylase (fatty acid hydroxylase superfamily)